MENFNRYKNRQEAGIYLSDLLKHYQDQPNTIILALPRGGVPVAYEISKKLHLPLDIFLVRKLGVPNHTELAMGAIANKDICFLNEDIIQQLGITEQQIQQIVAKEKQELKRRLLCYRHGRPQPELKDKTIILVDDGIATGATMKAAIIALKAMQIEYLIVAVPVASQESTFELSPLVDKFICPLTPIYFYGVGNWYDAFPQTSDEEVISLLENRNTHESP